jgi:Heterokaryon incompatibility protein (HET)
MATYCYTPLSDPKHIRLLSIQPGSGEDEVACSLSIVSLTSEPVFQALSYTWGDLSQKLPLNCGTGVALASANLHSALRHLRLADKARVIWVDALCVYPINRSWS